MNKAPKLIIWDFDGVIADTEKLWMKTNCDLLNEYFNLNWDMAITCHHLWGLSLKSKKQVLENLGIHTDGSFWDEITIRDMKLIERGLAIMPGVANIFAHSEIKQCIATGGTVKRTTLKLQATGLKQIFDSERVFSADLVENGKPAPDLFLLAAQKMGEKTQDCVVIEDSLAGMTAGLAAGMTTVAFMGAELNNTSEYYEKVRQLGVQHIFATMAEVEEFIFGNR